VSVVEFDVLGPEYSQLSLDVLNNLPVLLESLLIALHFAAGLI